MKHPRVLIIEDETAARELMTELLGNEGYEVVSAVDGPSGLAMLDVQHPDIVLCDIRLPGMDGYEVADRIRNGPEDTKRVPLVAVTGYAADGDAPRFHSAGFDACITKPLRRRNFVELVTAFLPEHGLVGSGAFTMVWPVLFVAAVAVASVAWATWR